MNENTENIGDEKTSCALIMLTAVFVLGCLSGAVIGGMAALYFATIH